MEEFLILLLVVLIVVIIIVPIISMVKVFSIDSRLNDIERELRQIKTSWNKAEATPKELPATVREETPEQIERVEKEGQVPQVAAATVIKEETIIVEKTVEEFVAEQQPTVIESVEEIQEEAIERTEEPVKEPERVLETEPEEQTTVEEPEEVYYYSVNISEEPKKKPATAKKEIPFRFENLLSKIGIVTLVLGIAFFVKYAIDKDWINEVGRVAIGVLTGGLLIGIAHKLRKKYDIFSAIMVGGGVSVLYITITLAFREYHLFNQTFAFILLIAITIFSVILSLLYDREELALFSLLGGFASPLLISTGEGNYVVLFSFLFILNSGMLIISMHKKWNIIRIVSFVCTLLFYWVWLYSSFENQYVGALTFAGIFFVQFYLLALFDHFLSGKKISPFQVAVILANNLSLYAASIYIFNEAEMNVQGLVTISMAIINAIVMIGLFRKAAIDKRLIYLIIAIVLTFVSLAIPVQLNGHVITMFWAAEIVILLWLWNKSGIKVFQVGFLLISGLTLISYLMDAYYIYYLAATVEILPVIFNRIFVTGLIVIAAFAISRFLLGRMENVQNGVIEINALKRGLKWIVIAVSYLVPFMEIYYQFYHAQSDGVSDFAPMVLAVYTAIYVAVFALIFRKKLQTATSTPVLLTAFILAYLAIALPVMIELRSDVFESGRNEDLFSLHYLALPALVYVFYSIAKSIKTLSKQAVAVYGWLLVACAVVILSVELDSTIAQLWANPGNYDDLMFDVRTFGYPILWGILAMILMIWGLKAKEALLRQISLGFFAFIILKFYISDIWLMSQTGRIISFVVLGIILLLVSFLIQKIKVLIKDDEEVDSDTNSNTN